MRKEGKRETTMASAESQGSPYKTDVDDQILGGKERGGCAGQKN